MEHKEWYVIDKRSGRIVNCITSVNKDPVNLLEKFPEYPPEHFRLSDNPSQQQLEGYEFWHTRP